MTYHYFPGCSLKGTGRAYEESFLAVFQALGLPVREIDDWNCCGATAYMSVDEGDAVALAARNLAKVSDGESLVAPCAGCYLVLRKAQRLMSEYPGIGQATKTALAEIGARIDRPVTVRHPLDILVNDVGVKAIKEKVVRPLKGLKVACYYGCQIVRPSCDFDDRYAPHTMDDLVKAIGATPVDFPLKTKCCGGSLMGTLPEVGLKLNAILLREMRRREADVVAVACPLCQFNLEAYQDRILDRIGGKPIPVLFFTQLVGLALGLGEESLGIPRQIVPPGPVIAEKVKPKAPSKPSETEVVETHA